MKVLKRVKIGLLTAVLAMACVALAACGGTSAEQPKILDGSGSYEVDGGTVELTDGKVKVSLEANPSTGYTWMLETGSDLVQLESEEFVSNTRSDKPDPAADQSGTQVFTFTGDREGTESIMLTYEEPWSAKDPEKTVNLQVAVGSDGAITRVGDPADLAPTDEKSA